MLETRRATRADLEAIWTIEVASFPSPWPRSVLAKELRARRTPARYFVALLDGTVVGYIGTWCFLNEAHIMTVAVHPDRRRRGIGLRLVLTALRDAHGLRSDYVTLEHRVANEAAAALYTRLGFSFERIRRGYYADTGEDAHVLSIEGFQGAEWTERLDEFEHAWEQRHGAALGAAGAGADPGH